MAVNYRVGAGHRDFHNLSGIGRPATEGIGASQQNFKGIQMLK